MDQDNKDLDVKKTSVGSSATTQTSETQTTAKADDVKKPTFDSIADGLIEDALKQESDTSAEDETEEKDDSSDVLKKNGTDESEEEVEKEEESTETSDDDDDEEQEKVGEEADEDEEEDDKSATTKTTDDGKHEKAIPYQRFKEVNDKVVALEPLAKAQQNVVEYCQKNQISPEQFQDALATLATLNTNPKEGLAKLKALVSQFEVGLGESLPKDLQDELTEAKAEVEAGTLSQARYDVMEKRAKELAKVRIQGQQLTSRQQQAAQEHAQQQQNELLSALNSWSAQKQKSTPGFKAKSKESDPDGMFEDFLAKNAFYWQQNPPQSVAQAIAIADKAFEYTMGLAKRYGEKPKAKKVITSTTTSTRKQLNGEPKTMDEVVKAVGRKHGYSM